MLLSNLSAVGVRVCLMCPAVSLLPYTDASHWHSTGAAPKAPPAARARFDVIRFESKSTKKSVREEQFLLSHRKSHRKKTGVTD